MSPNSNRVLQKHHAMGCRTTPPRRHRLRWSHQRQQLRECFRRRGATGADQIDHPSADNYLHDLDCRGECVGSGRTVGAGDANCDLGLPSSMITHASPPESRVTRSRPATVATSCSPLTEAIAASLAKMSSNASRTNSVSTSLNSSSDATASSTEPALDVELLPALVLPCALEGVPLCADSVVVVFALLV